LLFIFRFFSLVFLFLSTFRTSEGFSDQQVEVDLEEKSIISRQTHKLRSGDHFFGGFRIAASVIRVEKHSAIREYIELPVCK
jgi:hypothetical protein